MNEVFKDILSFIGVTAVIGIIIVICLFVFRNFQPQTPWYQTEPLPYLFHNRTLLGGFK